MLATSPIDSLLHAMEAHAPEPAFQWLQAIVQAEAFESTAFFNAYAGAGRRFATFADEARACLLVNACRRLPKGDHVALVRQVFRTGDNHERIALLRHLSLLPEPERFMETAIEACRTHVQEVFEAIACDNPYPATWFPDLHFQQLVMKVLFTQAALDRVHGWRDRLTAELQRMAADFASERAAAGREVPGDVALILQGVTR